MNRNQIAPAIDFLSRSEFPFSPGLRRITLVQRGDLQNPGADNQLLTLMANKRTRSLARLLFGRIPDDQVQLAYRVRVGIFFLLVVVIVSALLLVYQLTQTLYQLRLAEDERDRWQRPNDVIGSLNLKGGDNVADVGCGVGYFTLKLAPKVAEHGSVLAEDILGESLTCLWVRASLRHQSNIRIIHGSSDDPDLPEGAVDAVLIANSYHEFTKPLAILDHAFRALRSNGRLVVLDRGPRNYHGESREIQMQQYQIATSIVEDEIRQRGFEVISQDDRFIDRPATERPGDRPDDHVWWLIVARKP
jgi:ubiquinone/menaquinone biosynthesis C-methylase UbiE